MESELLHPSGHTEGTCTCRRDTMDDERKPRWGLRGPRVVINGELKSIEFWRSVIAECLATFFFVFLACITTLPWKKGTDSGIIHDSHTQLIQVAMGFGLSLAAMVHCFSHVSGGHINPAVSISMVTTCRISPARGMLYVFAQCGGSIAGAALLYGFILYLYYMMPVDTEALHFRVEDQITPGDNRGDLGVLILHPNINTAQAFGAELVLTFVLVFSTYATYDYGRGIPSGVHPLILGVIMTLLNMVGIPLTGCGLNPARALGPAFIKNYWKRHWIYWLAPVIGGFIAGVLYEYIFDPSRHMRLLSESSEDSDGGSPEGRFSQTNGTIPRGARSHCHENSGYETSGRGNHVEYELHETGDGEAENYRYTRTKF